MLLENKIQSTFRLVNLNFFVPAGTLENSRAIQLREFMQRNKESPVRMIEKSTETLAKVLNLRSQG